MDKLENKKSNKAPIIIIGTVIVVFVCIVSGFIWFMVKEYDRIQQETATNNSAEHEQDENQKKIEEANNKVYTVGEAYEGTMKITFLSYDNDFTDYGNTENIKVTEKIVKAEFEFENINEDRAKYVYTTNFSCYADDYDTKQVKLREAVNDNYYSIYNSNFDGELPIGKKTKGAVYFIIPKDTKKVEFGYNLYESTNGNKTIKFKAE